LNNSKKNTRTLISQLFFSKPILFVFGWIAHVLMRLLYSSLRVTVTGYDGLLTASKEPLIIALWHDQLLLGPMVFGILSKNHFAAVISNSRDGRLLASFIETFSKVKTILVGHRSRHKALLQMIQALKKRVILIITPDGPRGPKHEVKAGVIFSAQQSEAPIVAMRWLASSAWKLKTWDQLTIPKPFSKVTIHFEHSLACPKENCRHSLQAQLVTALTRS
jgi:lysophospholipid acyltransferase (LPLAT)-like uncharacterized protein